MISSLLVSILLSTGVTYAMPTNVSTLDARGFFDKLTGNDIIIGYRWVDQNQAAAEINRYGTLRAIPAMDEEKELLEGAYLSPSLDLRPDGLPSDYWECKITANDKLFLKRPMLFISDVEKVKRNTGAITNYISAHGMSNTDIPKTILFSEHRYTGGKTGYQMLIPPLYLKKSYYYSERKSGWGTNSLGIRAQCYQFGKPFREFSPQTPATFLKSLPLGCPVRESHNAEWEKWPIFGWPKDNEGSKDHGSAQHGQSKPSEH
ncbi:hypothetical protein F5050DRAFT_1720243 [Lentinula boryana]|uniref:Uncharacterized protein n=1 Tax=Lentinula boryana TaxID=40481 RepID=A0ABQ8QTL1_9AGAR|nr:hypothetical protein F5050DRAFT_1720243 [Lentinula boryana]